MTINLLVGRLIAMTKSDINYIEIAERTLASYKDLRARLQYIVIITTLALISFFATNLDMNGHQSVINMLVGIALMSLSLPSSIYALENLSESTKYEFLIQRDQAIKKYGLKFQDEYKSDKSYIIRSRSRADFYYKIWSGASMLSFVFGFYVIIFTQLYSALEGG